MSNITEETKRGPYSEIKDDLDMFGVQSPKIDLFHKSVLRFVIFSDISVSDSDKYPHMLSVKNCFIRGSVVR